LEVKAGSTLQLQVTGLRPKTNLRITSVKCIGLGNMETRIERGSQSINLQGHSSEFGPEDDINIVVSGTVDEDIDLSDFFFLYTYGDIDKEKNYYLVPSASHPDHKLIKKN